ncbi:hypothetical protein [Longispora albida]|uniref:hypothetical protein n=1 Tax=Longispora albida TaxID=203523 RepID=UPI0003A9332D|nr:hypothetical protein [Longispora albida]
MRTEPTISTGGFLGDPAEALNPPAATGGCCGSAPSATATAVAEPVSTCCGTVAEAKAEGSCCGSEAKAEAVAAGTGCCG